MEGGEGVTPALVWISPRQARGTPPGGHRTPVPPETAGTFRRPLSEAAQPTPPRRLAHTIIAYGVLLHVALQQNLLNAEC